MKNQAAKRHPRLGLGAWLAAVGTGALLAGLLGSGVAAAAPDGDHPAGFVYGTDSTIIKISGRAPYREPAVGGAYGGYIGMVGNWAKMLHCRGDRIVFARRDSIDANIDRTRYHRGIGTGAYWFMGGPGVDPHYNGTAAEARAWGVRQARHALANIGTGTVKYPVVFMDVELPGVAPHYSPAPDNGWNDVYTSPCSGRVRSGFIPARVDRAEFNGFADYLTAHSAYRAGVYSAPSIWADIFGTGRYSTLSNTYEWTYNADTASLANPPSGWCLRSTSTCAEFFGGITSSSRYAVMWQWTGGGGTYNGVGDLDQIDARIVR
jgi:hypothetical protein